MTVDILAELNPNQREAAETIEGPLLIIAGPGSGKTRVITHRIAYLVRRCGVSPRRIVAVTFTNKAARGMRQRLDQLLGPGVKDLAAGTFHAFCAMILRRDGEAMRIDRDFAIYDNADQVELIKRSMTEIEVDSKRFSPRAVQSEISGAKSQLVDVEGFALRRENYFDEIVLRVYERYELLLTQNSALDFDDLLLKTYFLFERLPEVRRKYQDRYVHFMIDEFQDTNVAQYAIAKQLSDTHRNLCVVGDPDQSIYSWRNADIRNILSFQTDYPEAKVVTLGENYRSTQTILDAAEKLIAPNTQRVDRELWTSKGRGVPIVVDEEHSEQEEAQFVVREVQNLVRGNGEHADRAYAPGDIAVMYRVNAQSRALEEACLRYGVPYQVVGGLKFYHRQEVKDLTAYLRLVANPNDDVSLGRVINVPSRGIGRRTLDELTRLARDRGISMTSAIDLVTRGREESRDDTPSFTPRSAKALVGFHDLVKGLALESGPLDLIGLIDVVLDRTGYKRYLLEDAEHGEERWENIQEFRATARDFLHLGTRDALTAFLESVSLVADVDSFEEKAEAITLITLHQAKGLEFPVVFIVGMEEGILPHQRSMDDPGQIEEERRLCYVGVTRAEDRLYLLRAFRRGFRGGSEPSTPSRFLLDIPQEMIVSPRKSASAIRASAGPSADRVRVEPKGWAHGEGVEVARTGEGDGRPRTSPGDKAGLSGAPLKAGDKVNHAIFGEGIVVTCSPSGDDFEVTVAFTEGQGVKRLLHSFAPLERLD